MHINHFHLISCPPYPPLCCKISYKNFLLLTKLHENDEDDKRTDIHKTLLTKFIINKSLYSHWLATLTPRNVLRFIFRKFYFQTIIFKVCLCVQHEVYNPTLWSSLVNKMYGGGWLDMLRKNNNTHWSSSDSSCIRTLSF